MSSNRMHNDEVYIDATLVSRLIAAQFPRWANLSIRAVQSAGTDNALYRLGDEMVVRLPRIHWATEQVDKEQRWLPKLAPFLPVAIPIPLAMGVPGEDYPWHWSIYKWLEGETPSIEQLANPSQVAADLAQFILTLQRIDIRDGPPSGSHDLARGKPLELRDTYTREAIATLDGAMDTDALIEAWEDALKAPRWDQAPVWLHGDMLPGNLLIKYSRLSGVIDFGALCIGDPACDLMIAWNLFSAEIREEFRALLGVDDPTWARGRGWALSQALIFIPYYAKSNHVGVSYARRAINEVLSDF
jgi:aminoglycoside phosphotransferase (APT) family kinase protein